MKRELIIHLAGGAIAFAFAFALAPPTDAEEVTLDLDPYGGLRALGTKPSPHFRIGQFGRRDLLVTPEGHGFFALGVNHLGAANGRNPDTFFVTEFHQDWDAYWTRRLESELRGWNFNNLGYGAPTALLDRMPFFGSISLAEISKHHSSPVAGDPKAYRFPDVFDPAWAESIDQRIRLACTPLRDNPLLIGWFWTDTPTLDLLKTRALRGTEWVSVLRNLPAEAPGRKAYVAFLQDRYAGRLDEFNEYYSQGLADLSEIEGTRPSDFPIGRHRVREDDEAFLARIAKAYYDIIGKAQRAHDPNHLVFGDRYLVGDTPDAFLAAAAPWIDAIAVQPGDQYTPLNPPGNRFPNEEIEKIHRVTGKPVLICDHAITFPTAESPRSVFEQMPSEKEAADATRAFLGEAFEKTYLLGYLRCQYVDRPAGLGRGLKHGLIANDGKPHQPIAEAYRDEFGAILKRIRDEATP